MKVNTCKLSDLLPDELIMWHYAAKAANSFDRLIIMTLLQRLRGTTTNTEHPIGVRKI